MIANQISTKYTEPQQPFSNGKINIHRPKYTQRTQQEQAYPTEF